MSLPKANFRHVGVPAFDPDELAKFYTRWFALVVSDTGSGISDGARVVFMTGDPLEHHQIAFANLRQPGSPGMQQLSFVFESLSDLKQQAIEFAKAGVPILQQKDHGNTWSVYVSDPEGNRIECYTPSPWYVPQPTWWPLDLVTESVELIESRTREMAMSTPGSMSRQQWMSKIQAAIDEARAHACV
jgi:catechol 2,3-dioxygenase